MFVCFFPQLPFLFLKSHCKLAHLSGIFSSLRFLSALPVQAHFHVFEQPRPPTRLCCLETRSGVGVTRFTDAGFGGSHRGRMWLGSSPECARRSRPPGLLCLVPRMSDFCTQSALHYSPHRGRFQLSRDSRVHPCSCPSHLRPTAPLPSPSPGPPGVLVVLWPTPCWGGLPPHLSLLPRQ